MIRLAIFNIAATALFLAGLGEGYVQPVIAGDSSRVVIVIGAAFLVGQWQTIRAARGNPAALVAVRRVAEMLVMLGLIGTVIGFVIAMSGIDPAAAGDVSRVSGMVAQMVEGMGVALYTTLAGAVLSLWLTVNRWILTHE